MCICRQDIIRNKEINSFKKKKKKNKIESQKFISYFVFRYYFTDVRFPLGVNIDGNGSLVKNTLMQVNIRQYIYYIMAMQCKHMSNHWRAACAYHSGFI